MSRKSRTASYLALRRIWHDTVFDPRVGRTPNVLSLFISVLPDSAILTDSYMASPVHVLTLSLQAIRGLPRLRAPGVVSSNSIVTSWCYHKLAGWLFETAWNLAVAIQKYLMTILWLHFVQI